MVLPGLLGLVSLLWGLCEGREPPIPTSCSKSGQVLTCFCDKNKNKPNFAWTSYYGHNLFKQIGRESEMGQIADLGNIREVSYSCDLDTKLHLEWSRESKIAKLANVHKITLTQFKSITLRIDLDLKSIENPPNITILLKDIGLEGGGGGGGGGVSATVGGEVHFCHFPCVSTKTSPLLMTNCNKCSHSIFSLKFERVWSVLLSNLNIAAKPDDEGQAVLTASGVDTLDLQGGAIDRVDKKGLQARECRMNGKIIESCQNLKTPPKVLETEAGQGSNLPLISLLVIILLLVVILVSAGCYFLITRNPLNSSDDDEEGIKQDGMERLNESSH